MTRTVKIAICSLPLAAIIVVLITYLLLSGIVAGVFITMASIVVLIVWAIIVTILWIWHRAKCNFWKVVMHIFWSLCATVVAFSITIMVVMEICA